MFEWDEAKRQQTLRDRGLDFLRACFLFDGRQVLTSPTKHLEEVRFISTGVLNDNKFYSVVWTWRNDKRRLISFRRARDEEQRAHRKLYGGSN